MAHIDTLAYYEKLIAAGDSELEAKAHVYALNAVVSDLVTKDDLETAAHKIEVKLNLIEKIGGSFCIAFMMLLIKVAIWP